MFAVVGQLQFALIQFLLQLSDRIVHRGFAVVDWIAFVVELHHPTADTPRESTVTQIAKAIRPLAFPISRRTFTSSLRSGSSPRRSIPHQTGTGAPLWGPMPLLPFDLAYPTSDLIDYKI